jgi:hypothetical protein
LGQDKKVGGYQITLPNPAGGILNRMPCRLIKGKIIHFTFPADKMLLLGQSKFSVLTIIWMKIAHAVFTHNGYS